MRKKWQFKNINPLLSNVLFGRDIEAENVEGNIELVIMLVLSILVLSAGWMFWWVLYIGTQSDTI